MLLLDTDVLVDILRQHPPARAWLCDLGAEELGIPGLVAMELLQGCRSRREQQRVEKLLRPYLLHWPAAESCAGALHDFAAYHLSHGLGLLDALVAHTARGVDSPLATFNEKHYRVVRGLRTIRPYVR